MSAILDTIIARGFNLNQPEFGRNMIEAQNRRQIVDNGLKNDELYRQAQQFDLNQAQQAATDQQAVGQMLPELMNLPQEAMQGAQQRLDNFQAAAAAGKVDSALLPKALEMLQGGLATVPARQQQVLTKMAERSPQIRDAMIASYMAPMAEAEQQPYILSPEEAAAQGLQTDQGQAWQFDPKKGYKNVNAVGGGVNVTNAINMPEIESAGMKEAAKLASKRLDAADGEAQKSIDTINMIAMAKGQLSDGIIAGTGADLRQSFATALETMGMGDGSAANTATYIATTSGLVAQVIKQFGAGSGLSDADREFARSMSGANVNLTPAALARILDIRAKAEMATVNNFNATRQRIESQFPNIGGLYQDHQAPEFQFEQDNVDSIPGIDDLSPEEQARLRQHLLTQ